MREFMKDYAKLCKNSGAFYKRHWKGVVVMNAVIVAAEYAYIYRDKLRETLEEKFSKNKKKS